MTLNDAFAAMKRANSLISVSVHNVCALNHTCTYIEKKLFKASVTGIGIFHWGEMDNSMVADTLAPRSASSSVATILTKQDKRPINCRLRKVAILRAHNNHKKKITAYFQNTVEMEKKSSLRKNIVSFSRLFFIKFSRIIYVLISRPGILPDCARRVAQAIAPPLWPAWATLPGRQARLDPPGWSCVRNPGDPVPLKKLDSL